MPLLPLVLFLVIGLLASTAPAQAATGDVTFVGCLASDVTITGVTGCSDLTSTTNSIRGFQSVATSRNGLHVYAASSFAAAVVHFSRDPDDGTVTFADCISSNVSTTGCAAIGVDALNGANSLVLSRDGEHLYVASTTSDSVTQLGLGSGALTFVACWSSSAATGCTNLSATTAALDNVGSLVISVDGNDLYTTSDTTPGAVAHFTRAGDGSLAFADCISSGAVLGCTNLAATTNAIELVSPIVISRDDKHLYVGADTRDALIQFGRSSVDGSLSFGSCLTNDPTTTGCTMVTTEGIRRIVHEGLAISPDSKHVYSASLAQAAVVQYDRSPTTGALSVADCITTAGSTGDCELLQGFDFQSLVSLEMAPDGASLYAGGLAADTVFGLDRDLDTGDLSFNDCISSTGAVPCIDLSATHMNSTIDPEGLAVSLDGTSLYIGSDTAFLHNDREPLPPLFADGFESGDTSAWSTTVP